MVIIADSVQTCTSLAKMDEIFTKTDKRRLLKFMFSSCSPIFCSKETSVSPNSCCIVSTINKFIKTLLRVTWNQYYSFQKTIHRGVQTCNAVKVCNECKIFAGNICCFKIIRLKRCQTTSLTAYNLRNRAVSKRFSHQMFRIFIPDIGPHTTGMALPRTVWGRLNRLRTGVGRSQSGTGLTASALFFYKT